MLLGEAGFLLQLAEHRLDRRFVAAHAALRELPPVAIDAAGPEHLAAVAHQDDAHIRPVAIGIDHDRGPEKSNCIDPATGGRASGKESARRARRLLDKGTRARNNPAPSRGYVAQPVRARHS